MTHNHNHEKACVEVTLVFPDAILNFFKQSNALINIGNNIMTAIHDFAVAQDAFNATIDAAVAALSADVSALDAQIAALQTSIGGGVSPEDQASLDALSAHSKALADKLVALDAVAKPVAPVAEPAPAPVDAPAAPVDVPPSA